MNCFKPTFFFENVFSVNCDFLHSNSFSCVLFDIDNTLIPNNYKVLSDEVKNYLTNLKNCGIEVVLVSNNKMSRVKSQAADLNILEINHAKKPLPFAINKYIKQSGYNKKQVVLVGDQLFTDILAGNNAKIKTVLVNPINLELENTFFKIKRFAEKHILMRKFG